LLQILIATIFLISNPAVGSGSGLSVVNSFQFPRNEAEYILPGYQRFDSSLLRKTNIALQICLDKGDMASSRILVEKITRLIESPVTADSSILAESYYLCGIYHSFAGEMKEALKDMLSAGNLTGNRYHNNLSYAKTLLNTGLIYGNLGEYNKLADYSQRYLDIVEKTYGDTSRLLIKGYSSLVTAYVQMQQYEKAVAVAGSAVKISNRLGDTWITPELITLYNAIGVCYVRLDDYSKAINYLEKTEYLYISGKLHQDENYLNLLNSLAVTYSYLGLKEKSREYYEKGIALAESINSPLSFNLVNSYAIELGNDGRKEQGESLLARSLEKAEKIFGVNTRSYIEVLKNYAEYLREFKIDRVRSLGDFEKCVEYIDDNQWDTALKNDIMTGYAVSLKENGQTHKALEILQELLFTYSGTGKEHDLYQNPAAHELRADKYSLKILREKYAVLRCMYMENPDLNTLKATAYTSELLISVLEIVRLNISEEESRLVLGERYREYYLNAIRDFNICYRKTGDPLFFEKVYEYAEKSKVAGLLASTRELKAAQFHVPGEMADSVNFILREITTINAMIAEENRKPSRNEELLKKYNDQILKASQTRDRLINYFEKHYPDYYTLKYNTNVVSMDEITKIIGKNSNYLNYVVSDTILYIFLVNKSNRKLFSVRTDSSFFNKIMTLKNILNFPAVNGHAKEEFLTFQETAYELYKILLQPVIKYLVSDRLVISPDNILSYMPFETLLTRKSHKDDLLYRDLPFALHDLKISYTYSVTLMRESMRKGRSFKNTLIAFAPVYPKEINIDSLMLNRQAGTGLLYDLPYARQEAKFVADLLHGDLYTENNALESVFKSKAGLYDIVHLSMHTILNDRYPMSSKMIFSHENDPPNDGSLNTWEIYGIPLKSKMVVLSSCNTGCGKMHSGEGIMSLARGFIYSGSESVVMSLWEVNDKSGTDIMEMFYRYLKGGRKKSDALRKARIEFLKNANQLQSHPYFWSTLIVYGNNNALFISKTSVLLILSVVVAIIVLIFYLLYRRNSLYS
jgi:CHAT domain-containing protein